MTITATDVCHCGQPYGRIKVTMIIDGERVTLCWVCARAEWERKKQEEDGHETDGVVVDR